MGKGGKGKGAGAASSSKGKKSSSGPKVTVIPAEASPAVEINGMRTFVAAGVTFKLVVSSDGTALKGSYLDIFTQEEIEIPLSKLAAVSQGLYGLEAGQKKAKERAELRAKAVAQMGAHLGLEDRIPDTQAAFDSLKSVTTMREKLSNVLGRLDDEHLADDMKPVWNWLHGQVDNMKLHLDNALANIKAQGKSAGIEQKPDNISQWFWEKVTNKNALSEKGRLTAAQFLFPSSGKGVFATWNEVGTEQFLTSGVGALCKWKIVAKTILDAEGISDQAIMAATSKAAQAIKEMKFLLAPPPSVMKERNPRSPAAKDLFGTEKETVPAMKTMIQVFQVLTYLGQGYLVSSYLCDAAELRPEVLVNPQLAATKKASGSYSDTNLKTELWKESKVSFWIQKIFWNQPSCLMVATNRLGHQDPAAGNAIKDTLSRLLALHGLEQAQIGNIVADLPAVPAIRDQTASSINGKRYEIIARDDDWCRAFMLRHPNKFPITAENREDDKDVKPLKVPVLKKELENMRDELEFEPALIRALYTRVCRSDAKSFNFLTNLLNQKDLAFFCAEAQET